MSTLIIAEKPSVAKSIATALGANKRNDGYFEGNDYIVTFAFGHLYTLADTIDYNPDMKKWQLKNYPFIPEEFIYKPINDPGVKKQIKIINSLIKRADLLINACDGDREGELIFAELVNELNINKPIKRLWITSQTPKDIEKGMNNLKDDMLLLKSAGYCRQKIDWIFGINFTVIFTLLTGGNYTLKVGRVLLPTLKLIFDREVTIKNFKSKKFYSLESKFKIDSFTFTGTYTNQDGNKFDNDSTLQKIAKDILHQEATIIKKVNKDSKQNPPKLFNLSDLQGHITSKYAGLSSDKVLELTQSLYEKKHLTYPRTASRFLDDSQVNDAHESFNSLISLSNVLGVNEQDVKFHTNKSIFDSSNVDSHPAIIPTYLVPDLNSLPENEKIVYLEVVKRFISNFMKPATYSTMEITLNVNGYDFLIKQKAIIEMGWKQLFNNSGDSEEQDKVIDVSNLAEGKIALVDETLIKEGKTNPPSRYTEKSLLKAMETCGNKFTEDKDILKGFSIGTAATMGDTIKKLINTGYINKKGKSLMLTELGAKVIHYFPVKQLMNVNFTGKIEKTLKDIEQGNYDPDEFMDKMINFIQDKAKEMVDSKIPIIEKNYNVIGICPDCKGRVIETNLTYSCEKARATEKACKFILWKEDKFFKYFGKKITEKIARKLVEDQEVLVKGLISQKKEGKKFNAVIKIQKNSDDGTWNYDMDFSKAKGQPKKKNLKFKY